MEGKDSIYKAHLQLGWSLKFFNSLELIKHQLDITKYWDESYTN